MGRYFKKISFLFLLSFFYFQVQSQPVKFAKVFGGNGFEYPRSVKQTFDKGYIVAGSTSSFNANASDIYLVKLDSLGIVKWHSIIGTNNVESGYYVIQTQDSGYAISGYTNNSATTGYDIYLIKTDKYGNVTWTKNIGGNNWDFAYHIQQTTPDLGYIVAGGTYSYGAGNEDGYLIKTDANGDTLWTKTFGGLYDEKFRSVKQTTTGDYICAGFLTPSFGEKENVYVVKVDTNGNLTWSKSIGGSDTDIGYDVVESTLNGNYYIAGCTKNTGYGNDKWDLYLLKVSNNNGDSLLSEHHGTINGNNEGYSICETASGNLAVAGYFETDGSSGGGAKDFYLLKTDLSCNNLWSKTYGGLNDEIGYGVDCTQDSGFVIVGETYGYPNKQSEILIIKTDSLGNTPGIVVDNTVGINEATNYNSPKILIITTNYKIFLQVSDAIANEEIKSVRIYDLLGRVISEQFPLLKNNNIIELPTSSFLANGIHVITVSTSVKVYSEKFLFNQQ